MKLDSKFFDGIRVGGSKRGGPTPPRTPECAWEGCHEPGSHKAPLGRDQEGKYLNFCVDHVRQYNKAYNYFSGLDDKDIQRFLKDAMTGHRPTFPMGHNGTANPSASPTPAARRAARRPGQRPKDPFNLFGADGQPMAPPPRRKVRSLEVKAFEQLGLTEGATGEAVRARYKALVKQLHPDANGGDRSTEDRLRDVIQAYKLLKQSGFC
ncbi:J domain-containing protein [Aurantimonas sp. Leaf443]|uniref:J domain-containing protein n=1 Tax=Aurantimonas sp. Leaf443 TaxID=1736378 RepID=UPI0006FFB732|nr:J domain-containing protein [Aurantimonas sp. Leaf443]KQT85862.1 molecular chaperone DnaJ [Aurantimonas sp. Leaf443]